VKIDYHAGSDYMAGQYIVVFFPNITEVSFEVPIFEDEIQEKDELFRLVIADMPNRVSVDQPNAKIFIADSTGELICCTCINCR